MSVAESRTSCPPFFFGTDRGAVTYADGQGFGTDVQQLSSSIDTMLFYEERNRLVIVTRSLLLTQYQVGDDGKVSRVMQVSMSVCMYIGVCLLYHPSYSQHHTTLTPFYHHHFHSTPLPSSHTLSPLHAHYPLPPR